jgi:hypothetical protein
MLCGSAPLREIMARKGAEPQRFLSLNRINKILFRSIKNDKA